MKEARDPRARVAVFGEALLDALPTGVTPGGAPLHVARHLRGLGLRPLLISCVGQDELGDSLVQAMERWGLSTKGVQRDASHPTGGGSVRVEKGRPRFAIAPAQAWDFVDPVAASAALGEPPSLLYFGTLSQRHEVSRR